jgi:hypothetical protein
MKCDYAKRVYNKTHNHYTELVCKDKATVGCLDLPECYESLRTEVSGVHYGLCEKHYKELYPESTLLDQSNA